MKKFQKVNNNECGGLEDAAERYKERAGHSTESMESACPGRSWAYPENQ